MTAVICLTIFSTKTVPALRQLQGHNDPSFVDTPFLVYFVAVHRTVLPSQTQLHLSSLLLGNSATLQAKNETINCQCGPQQCRHLHLSWLHSDKNQVITHRLVHNFRNKQRTHFL